MTRTPATLQPGLRLQCAVTDLCLESPRVPLQSRWERAQGRTGHPVWPSRTPVNGSNYGNADPSWRHGPENRNGARGPRLAGVESNRCTITTCTEPAYFYSPNAKPCVVYVQLEPRVCDVADGYGVPSWLRPAKFRGMLRAG